MSEQAVFKCPHCSARYDVFKVQADNAVVADGTIGSLICDGLMPAREGPYILKYFLVGAPRPPRTRARGVRPASQ
jgi:hypothetical protein